MNRRSLTLLELLLAIGLLLAMAALVFPTVLKGFGERAFESSAEVARNQLLLARAHAQAAGQPVEVTYYSPPSRVEARLFQAGLRGIEQGQSPDPLDGSDPRTTRSARDRPAFYADALTEPRRGRRIREEARSVRSYAEWRIAPTSHRSESASSASGAACTPCYGSCATRASGPD